MLRWQTSDIRELDALYRSDRGAIYALWHGRMFFPMYAARHLGICVLVSEHQDGELIATVLRRFGCNVVRGSTTHGGLAALLQMIRGWRPGVRYAITPDGPRGPRETVQPGVVHLARRLGLPIVPITGAASRCFTFKSWDRLMLPWPFSRAAFYRGGAPRGSRRSFARNPLRCGLRTPAPSSRCKPPGRTGLLCPWLMVNAAYCAYVAATTAATFALTPGLLVGAALDRWGLRERFFGPPPRVVPTGGVVWLHAASVGEVRAIAPLVGPAG